MRLFKRREHKPQRSELYDIPIGSMIELSDITTFALEEETSQTYEVTAYKKYEAENFLRYMYRLVNDEEVILGVDTDPNTGECELARFVIDSEEEFTEPLGDTIVMEFDDPENSGRTIPVDYVRNNIINTKMTTVTSSGPEEYYDVELQDYVAEDGTLLMVEIWDSFLTFYLGEPIERASVNVFPLEETKD